MNGFGDDRGFDIPSPMRSNRSGARLRVTAVLVAVAFSVTLAVIVGQRLSEQAMAVLAGATCGVGASIPTSLLIIWATRRQQSPPPARHEQSTYPPVIVVQPPVQPGAPAQMASYLNPGNRPPQREFTVVGGEYEEVNGYGNHQ